MFLLQTTEELRIFEQTLCDNSTLSIDPLVKENYHDDRP